MKEYYQGKILNKSTFDQTAVLYAVHGDLGSWWEKGKDGYNQIDEESNNRWLEGPKTNQS